MARNMVDGRPVRKDTAARDEAPGRVVPRMVAMSDETTPEQLRQHIKDLDAEIAELRRLDGDAQARRGEDGGESEGNVENEELATELTGIAENEAVIDVLVQRRESLETRLRAAE
ncbi:hypothetical protein L3i22_033470 [Actinoplanes sp. L3-i22]|nr:hypothetical protein L3i22_033470 [Actinoplanes sp. L3-i22]